MAAGRSRWVDVFKGILILLVVFGHAVQGIAADTTLAASVQHDSIKLAKDFVYSFHMPAFFVASGFFAGGLYARDMRKQLAKRVRRLVVPYFVWGLITACAMQIMSSHTNAHQGLIDFLYSPITPFSQLWYLYVLFFISLLHMGLSVAFRTHADRVLLGVGVVLYCAQSVVPNVWILHHFCQYTMFYAAGMLAFHAMNEHVEDARRWWVTAAGVLVLVAGFVLLRDKLEVEALPWVLCSALVAFAGTFAVYCVGVWERGANARVWRGLAWCGQESLALYVSHLLVVQGIRSALVRLAGVTSLWLVALVATVVGTAICCGGIALVKRTPLYRVLF